MRSEAGIQSAISYPVLCMRQVEKLVLADVFVPNLFLCSVFFLAGALAVISKRNSSGSEGQQAASTALRGLDVSPLPPYLAGDLGQAGFCFPAHHPALSWELEGPTRSSGHLGMFCQRSCCVQHDSIQAEYDTFSFIPVP